MSMTAVFVQVDAEELAKIEANPSLVEALFDTGPAMPLAMGELSQKMEERVRASGPQLMAAALANLDPRIREQLEARLGGTAQQFAAGQKADALLQALQQRRERAMAQGGGPKRPSLSLEKEWHGVHYLLCGEAEPGASLLSNAVMGGKPLGEDDEGFSGYGPARFFSPQQVSSLHEALSRPEVEAEASARFDAVRMNKLHIYPGWKPGDAAALMTSVRSLRDFYASAAANGHAVVTCLV